MNQGSKPIPPNRWPRKLAFNDPSPGGLLNQRILAHALVVLAKEAALDKDAPESAGDGDLFVRIVLLVCRKMSSVWLHMDRFTTEQARLVDEFTKRPLLRPPVLEMECSDTLFLEFDEFLVQIKSTLDHLVKLPRAIVGRSWNLATFGDKGQTVVNAMRNLPKQFQERAAKIETHLFQQGHRDWLDSAIRTRDEMNHYLLGHITVEKFSVSRDESGSVRVPMWSQDQTVSEVMAQLWTAFLYFVEDFITLFASLRFRDGTVLHLEARDAVSAKSPWKIVPKMEAELLQALQEGRFTILGGSSA